MATNPSMTWLESAATARVKANTRNSLLGIIIIELIVSNESIWFWTIELEILMCDGESFVGCVGLLCVPF